MTAEQNRGGFAMYPLVLIVLAILCFGRSMFLKDGIWDDNCWIHSYYSTGSLEEFLGTGFYEMRRVPMGVLYYYYYALHTLTDHAHLIWNSVRMIVQILSPLLLYYFVSNTSKGKHTLAFLIAAGFMIIPLDMTLPYYANINYRLGTFFCILSFYLTERALHQRVSWSLLILAMMASAFPVYFLLETAIMLEPARLLLIGYLLSERYSDRRTLIKRTAAIGLPFVMICVPLVLYRLINKPYGIYATTYKMDPYFFMNIKMHVKVLRHFLFHNWFVYARLLGISSAGTIMTGFIALLASFFFARRFMVHGLSGTAGSRGTKVRVLSEIKDQKKTIIFGLMLILPPVMMYEFSGRVPAPGMEGRHGTILLFGFSIVIGALLYCLCRTLASVESRKRWGTLLIVSFLALGVFFNNINLDGYAIGREYQKTFWKTFTARFPALPEKAAFLMDLRGSDYFSYYADLETDYELEFPLNMLYARSSDPETYRRYQVYPVSAGIKKEWEEREDVIFQRASHWGMDRFDSNAMIIIHYRNGQMLVNREILDTYPDLPYRMWLDKDPPAFSGAIPDYPLRYKLKGFY